MLPPGSAILDIGSHWLHQTFYFANAGHSVICAEHASQMRHVLRTAAAKGVTNHRLRTTGARGRASRSAGELLWKAIYRALRPGGHIVVTTPNAMFHHRLRAKLIALTTAGEYGINVGEIFDTGTHGHHWKEFSVPELKRYFQRLSPDFVVARVEGRAFHEHLDNGPAIGSEINLDAIISRLNNLGCQPWEPQLLLDVAIPEKRVGIPSSAPWEI